MTTPFTQFKSALLAAAGLLALSNGLLLVQRNTAQAQSPGVSLAALQAKISDLQSRVAYLEAHPNPGPQGPKGNPGTNGTGGTNGANGKDGAQGPKGDMGVQGPAGVSPFTVSGTDVTLSGYNLNIVNGLGGTATLNGTGNLIIGYNELSRQFTQDRTGSHNLVIGAANNYLSYGGLVAGNENVVSKPYASVTGGSFNRANAPYATVSGGYSNTASADHASVTGGDSNTASDYAASVTGGYQNKADGRLASVSGGIQNEASKTCASVSGGQDNIASGVYSSVSGGAGNIAVGALSSISGGGGLSQGANLGWSGGSAFTGSGAEKTGNFHSP